MSLGYLLTKWPPGCQPKFVSRSPSGQRDESLFRCPNGCKKPANLVVVAHWNRHTSNNQCPRNTQFIILDRVRCGVSSKRSIELRGIRQFVDLEALWQLYLNRLGVGAGGKHHRVPARELSQEQ